MVFIPVQRRRGTSAASNNIGVFLSSEHIVSFKENSKKRGDDQPPIVWVELTASDGLDYTYRGSMRDLHLLTTGRDMP